MDFPEALYAHFSVSVVTNNIFKGKCVISINSDMEISLMLIPSKTSKVGKSADVDFFRAPAVDSTA